MIEPQKPRWKMVKAHAGAECQRCSTKCGQALNFSLISLGVFDCIEIYGISMGHPSRSSQFICSHRLCESVSMCFTYFWSLYMSITCLYFLAGHRTCRTKGSISSQSQRRGPRLSFALCQCFTELPLRSFTSSRQWTGIIQCVPKEGSNPQTFIEIARLQGPQEISMCNAVISVIYNILQHYNMKQTPEEAESASR